MTCPIWLRMVPKDCIVSSANKWAAKNTNEIAALDGGVKFSEGRGALGWMVLNFWRWRTPVLYDVFVDGAKASL